MHKTLPLIALTLLLLGATPSAAQSPTAEQEVLQLSKDKW